MSMKARLPHNQRLPPTPPPRGGPAAALDPAQPVVSKSERSPRRWSAFALLLIACLFGCSGDKNDPAHVFNLTPPVRLLSSGYYMDGGTVSFVLVGARAETLRGGFDGRMDAGKEGWRCYIGDVYPTGPGARFLPLSGGRERALVQLLVEALARALPRKDISLLAVGRGDLMRSVPKTLEPLVGGVEDRLRTERALDRGLLADPDFAARAIGVAVPIRVDSVGLDPTTDRVVVRIRGARTRDLVVSFAASADSIMAPSAHRFTGSASWFRFAAGRVEDRELVTLVSMAFSSKSDSAYSSRFPEVEVLRRQLQLRTKRILERDAMG